MTAKPAFITNSSDVSGWLLLVDAIERLSGAPALEDVIDIVRHAARNMSNADGATFVMRDGDRCHYVDEDAIGPLWKGQKFPLTACISGWAMLNRQTAVIEDIYADPRIPHDAYRPTFVKSLVMVPVRLAAPLAAIGIYWARRHESTDDEVSRLESLARATATAIANVTLRNSLSLAAQAAQAQADQIGRLFDEARLDADRRRKLEDQLRHAQKMEAIGRLTGGLAHDFNNFLAVIRINLDLLSDTLGPSADERGLVGNALEAAKQGSDLTRSLLALARRQPLAPRSIDPNAVIASSIGLLRTGLGRSIDLDLRHAPDLWPVVADPAQFGAALTNMVNNACDAMPDGGRITLVTFNTVLDADYASTQVNVTPGDYAAIELSDTGTGMSPDVLARIFEPFFTSKEEGKGTGLGLAMVFSFIVQTGGHIAVDSEPGRGTTFRLYLPRDPGGAV